MDKETLKDYYYVMDRAFLDDSAALDYLEAEQFKKDNPEEAEEL